MKHIKQLYHTKLVKALLGVLGIDAFIKDKWHMWEEWRGNDKTIRINDESAVFAEHSLIPERHLQQELDILEDLLPRLREDDVFFDIGADAGLYSCLVKNTISNEGCVVAFEPHPIRRRSLSRNASRNQCSIAIRSEALADMKGKAKLEYALNFDESSSNGNISSDPVTVKTMTGDELINSGSVPSPDVMKIDVEGAELNVLIGLEEYLSEQNCRLLYIEIHDKIQNFGYTEDELIEFLTSMGYQLTELGTRSEGEHTERFIRAESV